MSPILALREKVRIEIWGCSKWEAVELSRKISDRLRPLVEKKILFNFLIVCETGYVGELTFNISGKKKDKLHTLVYETIRPIMENNTVPILWCGEMEFPLSISRVRFHPFIYN